MVNRRRTTSWRAPRMLSLQQQEELRAALAGPTDWMAAKLGRPVVTQRGWDYLQRLKHSQQVPRPRHALAAAEQQETCKKREDRSCRRSPPRFLLPKSSCGPPTNIGSV